MSHRSRRMWVIVTRWMAISALSAAAIVDAAQDYGVLMAINCFCLGIVVFSALAGRFMQRVIGDAKEAEIAFRAAEAMMLRATDKMEQAIQDGRVEVVPLQPFLGDHDGPTRH